MKKSYAVMKLCSYAVVPYRSCLRLNDHWGTRRTGRSVPAEWQIFVTRPEPSDTDYCNNESLAGPNTVKSSTLTTIDRDVEVKKSRISKVIKRSIIYIISFLSILLPSLVTAQNSPGINEGVLGTYLTQAAANNPGLQSRFNEYLAALEKIPQVGAIPDPQVIFGYFIQPIETRVGPQQARISATQMFPWFGTPGAKKDAATAMAQSKYEAFLEARSKLFNDVKKAWYDLYFTNEAIEITRENLLILNSFRRLALIQVEAGTASAVDVLRVDIEADDTEKRLITLEERLNARIIAFNNLLNAAETSAVNIPDSLPETGFLLTREAMMDSIRSMNHQIKQLESLENSWALQQVVARKAGNPGISIGLDYMFIGESNNPNLSASESGKDAIVPMAGLTIPLNRNKYNAMENEAMLMQESYQAAIMDKINSLESTFENTYVDYQDAERRMELFREQTVRTNRVLNILQSMYEANGQDFEELLRMERQLLNFRLELEKALVDMKSAEANIYYLMGR